MANDGLPLPDITTPFAAPKGFAVTPGQVDVDHGQDAPVERPAWSSVISMVPNAMAKAGALLTPAGAAQGIMAAAQSPVTQAAFRQDNTFGAYSAGEDKDSVNYKEDGFNPWEAIKGTKYEPYWESFVNVHNIRHADAVKIKIDREEEDRKTLDAAPWYQSLPAQMAAGVLDWPSLIPGGTFVRGIKGGFSIARSAASVGLAAGGSALAQEVALQALTETRTGKESAVNIGASTLLGGLLGAAGAKLLSQAEWNAAVKALEVDGTEAARVATADAGASGLASAGAAANLPAAIEANAIAGKAAGVVAKATERLNPALRLLQSPSAVTREVGTNLFENSIYLKKNFEGVASAPAVETLMKEWNGPLAKSVQFTNDAFSEYRKAGGALKRDEFRDAVGRAMRRGDVDADPFVTKVAQQWRREVFDPLKEAAIKAGLLPEDVSVDTAASYFSRMWNRNKLIAREGEFKGIVRDWVASKAPEWAEIFDKQVERSLNPLRREIDDLEMAKLRRGEEIRRREQAGGEVSTGEFSEADIRQAIRIVQGGAPKPKGVKTLTQFVRDAGGLVDYSGELAHMGINNRSLPGMVRTTKRRIGADNQVNGGGWTFDDMARHAWENGYFPEHTGRPTERDFLDALSDDFNKVRAVVREGDREAYRLTELVDQLDADLARLGIDAKDRAAPRFSTSEEWKGMVARVYAALDAEAERKIARLKEKLVERQAKWNTERDARFIGDPNEMGRSIADEVFNTLTGKTEGGVRPEFINVKARGPLKERTFNIPDHLVEDFLEHDVEHVGRRYTRVMGADVEMANKFGSVDMKEQIQKIRDDYARLRQGVTDEKTRTKLNKDEEADVRDIEALRDILRGTRQVGEWERNYDKIVRGFNHFNYIRSMGEVVLASVTDAVRPAMVHGLGAFMGNVGHLATNMKAVKLSVAEAQLAGNVAERVLGHRLATMAELMDPYASRSPVEAFLENASNVASKWNGIRLWTDGMKSIASVMTQNRILGNVEKFGGIKPKERAYLAYLGIDQSMAERIQAQFVKHGENIDGVRVAKTAAWDDAVAVRAYRAAINKDVDSIIVQKSVADVPLFVYTPTGKALLQFKSFALASHQKVLLRGLQEDQARFVGGLVAMTMMGMFITWMKAVSGNRPETQEKALTNPGWWIGEGLDRAGVFSVPMEMANAFEKFAGVNPIKSPLRGLDPVNNISQKNQNRSKIGSLLGPTAGFVDDATTALGIPSNIYAGEDVTKGQKTALKSVLPFNSYMGVRQMLNYVALPPE